MYFSREGGQGNSTIAMEGVATAVVEEEEEGGEDSWISTVTVEKEAES